MRAGRHHGWSRTGLVLVAAAAALATPTALGAGDTLSVSLPHTISGGVPFRLSVGGTMAQAAAEVWVAFDPSPPASCPADPTAGADSIFRGPVSGPGSYGAASGSLTLATGSFVVCAWLTAAADPSSVLATYGPAVVDTGSSTPPSGSTGPRGGSGSPPRVTSLLARPRTSGALGVSLTLSAPATVVLTLERTPARGRSGVVGSISLRGRAGVNRLTVASWRGHPLAKGSYTLVARARTAAGLSSPRRSSFTVH